MQHKDCAKTKGEAENGGGREEVVGGEAKTKGRTRAAQKGEGSAIGTGTRRTGSVVCTH